MLLSSSSDKLPVYTIEQVRELDRSAIQDYGIAGYMLMERAAHALFAAISQQYPSAKSLCIVCGAGNNAGDGYVLARLAQQAAWTVHVLAVVAPENLRNDAATAYQDYVASGGTVAAFTEQLPVADLLVDAVLGSGLARALEGMFKVAVEAINAYPKPVIAVDIPSGLNGNTGQALGGAVKADLTVTFIGLKQGLLTGQARDYVGNLVFADLALPIEVVQQVPAQAEILTLSLLKEWLPKRARCAHKGKFGHVLLVGGQAGMAGAIRLAGEAALRTGSGLVSIASHPAHAAWLNMTRPELMVSAIETAIDLDGLLEAKSAIGLGPGLGQSEWSKQVWAAALTTKLPLVLDADALNLLAQTKQQRSTWVLSPHPAEAARLLACTTSDIEQDRFAAVQALQRQYGGVVVLKGAGTLVADEQGLYVCLAGNPGMATAGMGDVLTGAITSLLGQGLSLTEAACAGVLIHALAGDQAAQQGERGLIASDVLNHLREFVNP